MTTLQIPLSKPFTFTQDRAVSLAQHLSRFEASILIHDGNRTVNAKSLLGILSLGYIESESLEFMIDGVEVDEIREALTKLFEEMSA